jgi:L-threonylcarbamoyladenylate synthase
LTVSAIDPELSALHRAAAVLQAGGLVVFPTDTYYGLAADPRNPAAVERVFEVKGRSIATALPLIAADFEQVVAASHGLSHLTTRLARAFWPGPLTLVVDAASVIAPGVHGGAATVAIRVPDHALARGLAACAGFPIVSTSANRSGQPPVNTPDEVEACIANVVDLVIDGGRTVGDAPSTIVDARTPVPLLIRAGAVPFARVLEVA